MESDAVGPAEMEAPPEVMAAIETGPVEQLIIADISTDEAHVTVPLEEAASLPAWR